MLPPKLKTSTSILFENREDAINKGSANFFCKRPESKYFSSCRPNSLHHNPQFYLCSAKVGIDNK